ncbi:hypothetical protein [Paenibacillus validus]|uniref:hypothetical protein n=1 Tax=Paenibacillus validus TaxID=44253 RepID=UPI003D28C0A7
MKRLLLAMSLLLTFPLVTYAENIHSEVLSHGENGQVSTITGNGTQGQGTYTLDHPRFPGADSKGNVYFLDGSQKTMKLRKWDGTKNTTIVDMKKNTVTAREGEFFSTGLQVINDQVYFSSEEKVYKLIGDRVTELDPAIKTWMKDNHYVYIFRMEQYKNDLVLMLFRKGDYTQAREYGFIKYNLNSKEIEEVMPAMQYPNPSNFFMQEKGLSIASLTGAIYYDKFFPLQFKDQLNTNQGGILDVWIDDSYLYHVINKDQTSYEIHRIPIGEKGEGLGELVAGGYMGFTDGIADEVRMDYPTDFSWDGTGFLFADRDSNAIRKLWINSKPLNYGDER